jgi:S1-C subfamily serine protease
MNRKWMQLAVAVAVALPAALAAQETPRPSPAPRARARAPFSVFSFSGNRGRIGVIVNTAANADSDKIGARIEGVTPGGPAAKAGLKVGDIITKFNGTSLAGVRAEGEEDESGPGAKLVELAHNLDPGDSVQVEYRRGSDAKKATLVAEEVSYSSDWRMSPPPMPPMPELAFPPGHVMVEPGMGSFGFCFGEGWCDLNLVRLNADLGEYFGTSEGLLVVKAPADSSLPLRSGDVILSIGGRKPTTAEHAMRILRSYDVGETVSIEIMRKQKRVTLAWKVPEREDMIRARPSRTPRHNERGEASYYRILPKVQERVLAGAMAKVRALGRVKWRSLRAI